MKTRLPLIAIALVLAAAAQMPRTAGADAHTYASVRRQVRAGILQSSALTRYDNGGNSLGSENPDPHFFYVLDRRNDLKPIGMEFLNPLAPPVITGSIYDRWRRRVTGTDPAFVAGTAENKTFQIGAKVTKNMGAYWEVDLDSATAQDLQQYDLLFLHSHIQNISFSADQRERLRKFVESGGTLFVENCGRMSFDNNAPFIYDINFRNGANPAATAVVGNQNHPLLSEPFLLPAQELSGIGDKQVNDFYIYRPDPDNPADTGPGPDNLNPPGGGTLVPVVWNTRGFPAANIITPNAGWRPYILAGSLGAGRMVVSSADVGCAVNDYVGGAQVGYGGNSGAISGELVLAAKPTDLKFMYNMALWSTAHATSQTDPRRSGATDDKPGAKLAEKWVAPALSAATNRVGGPAFFKHCLFMVDGDLVLHCFDAIPGQDLDGDGNTDEGIPDLITGLPYDEIWRFDLKTVQGGGSATGASSPTVIEFFDGAYNGSPGIPGSLVNFKHREQVVVVLSNGTVVAVRAFPRLATGGFPMAPVSGVEWVATVPGAQEFTLPPNSPVPAAAWSEGVVFASIDTAASGMVAAINPTNGSSAFDLGVPPIPGQGMVPGDVVQSAIGPVASSPSVGYIRDNATGANDKIVYVHALHRTAGNVADSIQAFPFGTKGEPLTRQGTSPSFTSRSTGTFPAAPWYLVPDPNGLTNRNDLLKQRVFATYKEAATGRVYSVELKFDLTGSQYADTAYTYAYTPGQPVRITLKPQVRFGTVVVDATNDSLTIYADYTLDWSTVFATKVKARSTLFGPQDIAGSQARLGGAPALSSEDMVYFTADTSGLESVNSGGRGVLFGVAEQGTNRSALKWAYSMHDGVSIRLDDGSTFQVPPRLRFVKRDGAFGAGGGPLGQFLSQVQYFGTPAVRNGVVYATAHGQLAGNAVSVICAFRANPEIRLSLGPGIDRNSAITIRQVNPVVQQNAGNQAPLTLPQTNYTVDFASGIVRINSMAFGGGTNGFLSTSIPFQVKVGAAPERLIYGTQVDAPGEARMIGPAGVDNLLWYMVVPQIIGTDGIGLLSTSPSVQGDVLYVGTAQGYILSFDADPASNDPAAQGLGAHVQLLPFASGDVEHLRWVQRGGQGTARLWSAPAGTGTVMGITSAAGTSVYEDTRTLIADGKRILEVNAAGEAVWSCDGTRTFGVAGGGLPTYFDPITGLPVADPNSTGVPVQQRVAWARPQVARRVANNNMLVVDSGNNRVVEIDRGGNVIWEVNRMQADMLVDTTLPAVQGQYRAGDPLTLNEPTDCLSWTEFVPNLGAWLANNGLAAYGNANVPGYVLHYLVADTGNFRIVEIVDVLNASGQVLQVNTPRGQATLRRQLVFVSGSYPKYGKRFRYRSLQRLSIPNGLLVPPFKDPIKGDNEFVRFTLGLVQNYRLVGNPNAGVGAAVNAFGQNAESGGGSIVVLNEAGDPISVVSNLRIPNPASPNTFIVQPIVNPVWFSKFDEYDATAQRPIFKFLLADANGVYQMKNAVDPMTNQQDPRYMDVEWMLSSDDYYAITGKRLNASSIIRLNSAVTSGPNTGLHHFLIANRFSGEDNPAVFGVNFVNNPALGNILGRNEFHGEVFQINPATFTWADPVRHGYEPDYIVAPGNYLVPNPNASIVWRSPSERVPTPGAAIGVIERFIGSKDRATSTSLLEQPAFADRPF